LAWIDEFGNANEAIPGAGLDIVFDAKETILLNANSNATLTIAANSIPGITSNLVIPAAIFQESLSTTHGRIVARFNKDNSPAIIESAYHMGRTLYIGTFLAISAEKGQNLNATTLIQANIMGWAGVHPSVIVSNDESDSIEVRLLTDPKDNTKWLLIVINRSENKKSIDLQFDSAMFKWSSSSVYDMLNEKPIPVQKGGSALHIQMDSSDQIFVACILLDIQ
jgi:hypothetical protein